MDKPIAELWAEAVALEADINADESPGGDEYRADDWDRVFAMETAVLEGPILSSADAVAKLKAAHLTFERGERSDGLDESAVAQTIAWLEAQS